MLTYRTRLRNDYVGIARRMNTDGFSGSTQWDWVTPSGDKIKDWNKLLGELRS